MDQQQLIASRPADSAGWKIGLNVAAVQEHFGLDGPVVGWLAPPGPVAAPTAEREIAAWIGEGGGVAALGPAIELVEIDPTQDTLEKIFAVNVFHRGVVLGDPVPGATHRGAEEMVGRARQLLGDQLGAGDVLICGALEILQVEPGQEVVNDLTDLGLGSVSVRMP